MNHETKFGKGQGIATQLQGQAAVWAVASQLALRGVNPLFPGIDYGYDLKLENGLRIQVKSARLQTSHPAYRHGAYTFAWRKFNYVSPEKRVRIVRHYQEVCDFLILWGVDENRFWIVPSNVRQQAVWFNRKSYEDFSLVTSEMVSNLKNRGMSAEAIAKELNTSRRTVNRIIKGGTSAWNDESGIRYLRTLEDRWDLLNLDAAIEKVSDQMEEFQHQVIEK